MKKPTPEEVLAVVEEIAANESGSCETPGEKRWSLVYVMCHAMTAPKCLKNHPDFMVRTIEAVNAMKAEQRRKR